jgi:ferrous iron transport protein B
MEILKGDVFKLPILDVLRPKKKDDAACHTKGNEDTTGLKTVCIVGSPNVGKSVLFNALTGRRVIVSNYPGTTVEVSRGVTEIDGQKYGVIDTPGMYSLFPITEEERVARSILWEERPDVIVHVVDAKNLERMLSLTLQLLEANLPVILVLNIMDEAERLGIEIDFERLRKELNIPVLGTVFTTGRGLDDLKNAITEYTKTHGPEVVYEDKIETAVTKIEEHLMCEYTLSKRAMALFLLQGDSEVKDIVKEKEKENFSEIESIVASTTRRYSMPLRYMITMKRYSFAGKIVESVFSQATETKVDLKEKLSRAMMRPLTGIPILFIVLYIGLYQFVGNFGAQILVGFLEEDLFGNIINPGITWASDEYIPWQPLRDLIAGDYGIITLGITYAIAIVLPIVGTFFLAFSIIEDTGYLPRLAMLIDRVFKKIGLNGRAVIPMVLGFGCDTMATIVTRTQETKRERVITTFLLALAIPCSAQLGVIFGVLSFNPMALIIWGVVVFLTLIFIGYMTSKVLPGEKPSFYMEVPPLRMPKLSNVLAKTYARMKWYFLEILPIFILASILIWLGNITGVFPWIIRGIEPLVMGIGLPKETADVFLFGFFRRDYGAAGLLVMYNAGAIKGIPLVVAAVTLTLFIPCIAQFAVMIKERGIKTAIYIALFIFPFAFFVGWLLNLILTGSGVVL